MSEIKWVRQPATVVEEGNVLIVKVGDHTHHFYVHDVRRSMLDPNTVIIEGREG